MKRIYLPVEVWIQTIGKGVRKELNQLEVTNTESFNKEFPQPLHINMKRRSLDHFMNKYDRLLSRLTKVKPNKDMLYFSREGAEIPILDKSDKKKRAKYFKIRLIDPINQLRELTANYCAVVYSVAGIDPDDMRVVALPDGYVDLLWQPHQNEQQLAMMETLREKCVKQKATVMSTYGLWRMGVSTFEVCKHSAIISFKEMLEWAKRCLRNIANTKMWMINFTPEKKDSVVLGPSDSDGNPVDSTTNDFKILLAEALGKHFGMNNQKAVEWRVFFLATVEDQGEQQRPHIDHTYVGPTRRLKLPLWAMDMPLTRDGGFLKVWPGASKDNPVQGQKLFFRKGEICLRRSTLIHAGGFNGPSGGYTLRMHASLGTEDDHHAQLALPNGGTYGSDPRTQDHICFHTFCL